MATEAKTLEALQLATKEERKKFALQARMRAAEKREKLQDNALYQLGFGAWFSVAIHAAPALLVLIIFIETIRALLPSLF